MDDKTFGEKVESFVSKYAFAIMFGVPAILYATILIAVRWLNG